MSGSTDIACKVATTIVKPPTNVMQGISLRLSLFPCVRPARASSWLACLPSKCYSNTFAKEMMRSWLMGVINKGRKMSNQDLFDFVREHMYYYRLTDAPLIYLILYLVPLYIST